MAEKKEEKKLTRIVIDSVEKDDWIKHANPKAAREELEIHERLAKKYAAKKKDDNKKSG